MQQRLVQLTASINIIQYRRFLKYNRRYQSPNFLISDAVASGNSTGSQSSPLLTRALHPSSHISSLPIPCLLCLSSSPLAHIITLASTFTMPHPSHDNSTLKAPPPPFASQYYRKRCDPPTTAGFALAIFSPGVFVGAPSSLALTSRKWYKTMSSMAREPRKMARR